MDIKKIRVIRPRDRKTRVLCFADVSLRNGLILRDIRIIRGKDRKAPLQMKMPVQEDHVGVFREMFRPSNKDSYNELRRAILVVLREAQKAGLYSHTVEYGKKKKKTEPQFSHAFAFPMSHHAVKCYAVVVVDNCIVLDRLSLVLDKTNSMLRLEFPKVMLGRIGGKVNCYQVHEDDYKRLYGEVAVAYAVATARQMVNY